MKKIFPLYVAFFFSGLSGLLYEIVWGRQLVVILGNTTHSLVAVLAAFFTGLALGSLLTGKVIDRIADTYLLKLYAFFELAIGILSAFTIVLFPRIKDIYPLFSDGTTNPPELFITKFLLAMFAIVLPTFFMGGTFPIVLRVLRSLQSQDQTVSTLYAINTFGGVTGVFLTGFIFIELFGLSRTLLIGVAINSTIALCMLFLPLISFAKEKTVPKKLVQAYAPRLAILTFFLSGFTSIAYQVLWTRLLIPATGTFTYAFSIILILNLLGIAIGSFLFKKIEREIPGKYMLVGLSQLGIALSTIIAVVVNHFYYVSFVEIIIRVLPATLCMGIAFPALTGLFIKKQTVGDNMGTSYFFNTFGSIIGSFVTSFIFIPRVGTSMSVLFLSLINVFLAYLFISRETHYNYHILRAFRLPIIITGTILGVLLILAQQGNFYPWMVDQYQKKARQDHGEFLFKEDEVASVLGYSDKNTERLLIDGYGTTSDTLETRMMAHLPITLHSKPKRILIICLGMGTTFRSALKYNVQVDIVELVPSVPSFMNLFHHDAGKWLANTNGKVIINDGRSYAFLTDKKYDIVIIDPPPPFSTAGSSVLYTKEFYTDLKKLLSEGGIVSQWLYYAETRNDEALMAVKSFTDSFNQVGVFRVKSGVAGLFLEGSQQPLAFNRVKEIENNTILQQDILELFQTKNIRYSPAVSLLATREDLLPLVSQIEPLTDDKPKNEYFFLRYLFTYPSILNNEKVQKLFLRN